MRLGAADGARELRQQDDRTHEMSGVRTSRRRRRSCVVHVPWRRRRTCDTHARVIVDKAS